MPATIRAAINCREHNVQPRWQSACSPLVNRAGRGRSPPLAPTLVAGIPNGDDTMTPFVLRSSLDASHRSALERLMYFNARQHEAEIGIADVVDAYGAPIIVADGAGL